MTNAIDFVLPQTAGVLSDYNAPDYEYGGGRPASFKSADGTRFWGTLEKQGGSSGTLKLIIYRTSAAGALISTWADSGIIGQGGLVWQPDGTLEAVGYTAYGDNATMRAVPVPGWVAWPASIIDTTARDQATQALTKAAAAAAAAASASAQASTAEADAQAALAAVQSAGGSGSPLWEAVRQALKAWLSG